MSRPRVQIPLSPLLIFYLLIQISGTFLNIDDMYALVSKRFPILVISILLALIFIPSVSGETTIHGFGDSEVDITAGDSCAFEWGIWNQDDTMYLVEVKAELSDSSVGSLQYVQNYTLESGSDEIIRIEVNTYEGASTKDVTLNVQFIVQDLSQPGVEHTHESQATIHISSISSSVGNKIFGWENTLPAPFNSLIWTFIITLIIWVLIGLVVYFIIDPFVERFILRTKTKYDNTIYDVTRVPILITILLYGLVSSVDILSISNNDHILMHKSVIIILTVIYTLVAYRIFDRVFINFLRAWSNKVGSNLGSAIIPILHFLGMILIPVAGITFLLNALGINVALLVAGVGVGASIVTLAAKDVFSSFFAGLQVMLDRPFKIGDRVMLDSGEICEVKKIGIRSTQLYDLINHDIVIIPNTMIAADKITNYSEPDNHRALYTSIGVAYGSDVKKVESILLDIANNHPDIVHNNKAQAPYVRFANFGSSSLDFSIWYYVNDIKKMWRVNSEIKTQINKRFNEEGIEIPFTQNVITFNNPMEEKGAD